MLSAENLGIFLEVTRTGRLTEAAKHLGLDQSTVSRHMSQLERSVGRRLFNRDHAGWMLTDAGIRLLSHAEAVESAMEAAREDTLNANAGLTGSVRMLTPDGFGGHLITPGLSRIRKILPGLDVELVSSNQHTSLSTREFDLAVSIERPKARAVSVTKLADFEMRIYAAPAYLADREPRESVTDYGRDEFVWYVEGSLGLPTYDTLFQAVPNARPTIHTTNIDSQIGAAQQGLCLAFLPTWIGDLAPGLVRVDDGDISIPNSYWLVIPTQFVRLARVRAITRPILELVAERPGLQLALRSEM